MPDNRMNVFEIVLLVVGLAAAFLGFQMINQLYRAENGQLSWLMIIAIFDWLTLLSLMVDVSKRELNETRNLIYFLMQNQNKKK